MGTHTLVHLGCANWHMHLPRTPGLCCQVGPWAGLWGWVPMPRPCGGGQPTGPRLFLGNFAAFISVQMKAVIAREMILIGV